MRARAETLLITALAVFAFAGVTAVIFHNLDLSSHPSVVLVDPIDVPPLLVEPVTVAPVAANSEDAGAWFQSVRQFCNPVDVETRLRWQPAPATEDGVVREAACYALAGKIALARERIESLPEDRRYHAAGFVFNVGHPAADAGDDLAAGPLMELVVEYTSNDGWTASARSMLTQISAVTVGAH
jgi:hypothetical protein